MSTGLIDMKTDLPTKLEMLNQQMTVNEKRFYRNQMLSKKNADLGKSDIDYVTLFKKFGEVEVLD